MIFLHKFEMSTEVCLACSVERDLDELSEADQQEYYIDYESFDLLENGQNPYNYIECCYLCEQHKYLRDYEIDKQTDNYCLLYTSPSPRDRG